MSKCNPCPPCETSFPIICEPLSITTSGQRVVVEDSAGCKKTIQQPTEEALLLFNETDQKLEWIPIGDVNPLLAGTGVFISDIAGSPYWFNGSGVFVNQSGTFSFINGLEDQYLKIGAGGALQFDYLQLDNWIAYNASTTLTNEKFILGDTSGGPISLTLPIFPYENQAYTFADKFGTWATNNLTIIRSGQTIDGLAQDLVCNINRKLFTLIFNGANWEIFTV